MVYISDSRGKLICDGCLEGGEKISKERGRSKMVTGEGLDIFWSIVNGGRRVGAVVFLDLHL